MSKKAEYKSAYIAGALTRLDAAKDTKEVYEHIAAALTEHGVECYVPHMQGTDPVKHPDVSAYDVWKKDLFAVSSRDVIIAYVGEPSLGVGAELELARINDIPIVLWWFKGETVSRMARGNPGVIEVLEVADGVELAGRLQDFLTQ